MADLRMPALGADMERGKVVRWLVAPGATVHAGDVVVVVETHKGAIDCEVFLDGVIDDLVPEGSDLAVGEVLAHVRTSGDARTPAPVGAPVPAPIPARDPASVPATVAAAPATPHPVVPSAPVAPGSRVRASPAARRRAQALALDLAAIAPSRPGAPLVLVDVERAALHAPAAPAVPAAPRTAGFDPVAMRQGIALAMARSKREIPHYYLGRTIDFGAAQRWVDACNAQRPPLERLLPAVLLLKASALALARHPQFNGFWVGDAFRPGAGVHVGWAVAMRGGGLVAPAVHDADAKPLDQLMRELRDLVQRVRAGGLRGSEMTDPTATVTSMGDRGADRVDGVIYPPQVALVGFGAVRVRPWVDGGQVLARPLVEASLAADHRASDGHAGSLLLAAIDDALQRPDML